VQTKASSVDWDWRYRDKGLIKVVSPIDDTPAFHAGIKAGDIITALDGKTRTGLVAERRG